MKRDGGRAWLVTGALERQARREALLSVRQHVWRSSEGACACGMRRVSIIRDFFLCHEA